MMLRASAASFLPALEINAHLGLFCGFTRLSPVVVRHLPTVCVVRVEGFRGEQQKGKRLFVHVRGFVPLGLSHAKRPSVRLEVQMVLDIADANDL